ncbi:hypothetical protein JHK82_027853 [Glycine max]|nr:hypothetical protein JHK82_027853 [Glycine max]
MQEKSGERQEQVLFSFSMSDREEGKGEEGGGQLIVGTEMELIDVCLSNAVVSSQDLPFQCGCLFSRLETQIIKRLERDGLVFWVKNDDLEAKKLLELEKFMGRGSAIDNISINTTTSTEQGFALIIRVREEEQAIWNSYPLLLYFEAELHRPDSATTTASLCCSICLADYKNTEWLKLLPDCGHMFHRDCIDISNVNSVGVVSFTEGGS